MMSSEIGEKNITIQDALINVSVRNFFNYF